MGTVSNTVPYQLSTSHRPLSQSPTRTRWEKTSCVTYSTLSFMWPPLTHPLLAWFFDEPCQSFPKPRYTATVPDGRELCGYIHRGSFRARTRALSLEAKRVAQSYIVKHIFSASKPPVNLRKVAIGNGFLGSYATVRHLPVVRFFIVCPNQRYERSS